MVYLTVDVFFLQRLADNVWYLDYADHMDGFANGMLGSGPNGYKCTNPGCKNPKCKMARKNKSEKLLTWHCHNEHCWSIHRRNSLLYNANLPALYYNVMRPFAEAFPEMKKGILKSDSFGEMAANWYGNCIFDIERPFYSRLRLEKNLFNKFENNAWVEYAGKCTNMFDELRITESRTNPSGNDKTGEERKYDMRAVQRELHALFPNHKCGRERWRNIAEHFVKRRKLSDNNYMAWRSSSVETTMRNFWDWNDQHFEIEDHINRKSLGSRVLREVNHDMIQSCLKTIEK